MDYQLLAIILLAVLGWIFGFYQWRKSHMLSKETFELENIKLAPQVNIGGALVYKPYEEKEDKSRAISVNVDNSGVGEANSPKCFWKLILKNGKEYSSQEWLDFIITEEDELIPARSYIPANSPFYEDIYHFKLVTSKEGDLFDTLKIWLKCKDARNLEWQSDAEFQYTKEEGWTTKRESRTYRVSQAKKRFWRK